MAFMQYDQPVQTLTTNRADQPLAERIRLRTAHRRFQDGQAESVEKERPSSSRSC
jgi:hypothetical protein